MIAVVSVLCRSSSCADMAAFGRAKESFFRSFLNLKRAIPSRDTFSSVFQIIEPSARDAAFGKVRADVAALLRDGDVIANNSKALHGARDKSENARTRMVVSAYAARLRLTLAKATADHGTELDAALKVLGLIVLKGKIVMADALHCNRRKVAAINTQGGDWCLSLKANQDWLMSDARACYGKLDKRRAQAYTDFLVKRS
jgi:hypothetical protein